MEFRALSTLTIEQGLELWNKGFEGYFFDMTFSMDRWISRFATDGLSPELSVVGFIDGEPVGFVLNGIRMVQRKKVAWNGGTGVIKQLRGRGIGSQLIAECLEVYRQQGVKVAALEAIAKNESANRVYEKMGYRVIDRLAILRRVKDMQNPLSNASRLYNIQLGQPGAVASLPFYNSSAPWQNQWANIYNGESVIVLDNGEPVGYALYRRMYTDHGKLTGITLYQCATLLGRSDDAKIVQALLDVVFPSVEVECVHTVFNASMSNPLLYQTLAQRGFEIVSEQVQMMREMEE